ncbi:MAG: LysR family transcriptional regulator [Clostridia bacterium]|nr:LysR family transcriptional regulator [Clostridia bacterium]
MEIRNLITFVYVAELNSFTKAAKALDYSQSTVSFQIKQLENELDCLLFERINHKISLTDKGEELLAFARKIRYLTDEFNQMLSGPSELKGFLRIATADSLCEDMILRNYSDFYRKYPAISLKFIPADTDAMFSILDSNEADLMLTLDRHVYHQDYVIVKEEPVYVHFVTGAHSPYATKKILSLSEIAALPMILTEAGVGYRRILEELTGRENIPLQPIMEIGRTDIIVAMLESGIGVSFLPDFVTKKKIEEGKLVYLEARGVQAQVWKQLIYHKNKWVTKSMQALIDYISENEFGK